MIRAKRNISRSHQRLKERYNRGRKNCPHSLDQNVMLRNYPQSSGARKFSAKLAPRFRRPFKIVCFVTPVTVLLHNPDDHSHVRPHRSQQKAA